jgi:L-lactate dehydrogenase complex protein LldF
MITAPRGPLEKDGPLEVHVVILDNGRSRIFSDPELKATLKCIRCGACMNHCPVYTRVGGHAYEAVYPGPIGKILTPQTEGLESRHDLTHASSLCHACTEVCPVGIPISRLLVRLRAESARASKGSKVLGAGKGGSRIEGLAWAGWRAAHASPFLYKAMSAALRLFGPLAPRSLPLLKAWTSTRTVPKRAKRTLHDLVREKGISDG